MTKDERFADTMEKLKVAHPVEFNIDAVSTFCMVGAMRLALRHPKFNGPMKQIVQAVTETLSESLIRGMPELKEFLDDMAVIPSPPDIEGQQMVNE